MKIHLCASLFILCASAVMQFTKRYFSNRPRHARIAFACTG